MELFFAYRTLTTRPLFYIRDTALSTFVCTPSTVRGKHKRFWYYCTTVCEKALSRFPLWKILFDILFHYFCLSAISIDLMSSTASILSGSTIPIIDGKNLLAFENTLTRFNFTEDGVFLQSR